LLGLQYSSSLTFLNLNLFFRLSIQLSDATVLRIYNQIIVFQVLFLSASSFASAFCTLKPIFLLWSYKLYHSTKSCHIEQAQFYLIKEVQVSRRSDALHNGKKWNQIKSNQIKLNRVGGPSFSEKRVNSEVFLCPETNPYLLHQFSIPQNLHLLWSQNRVQRGPSRFAGAVTTHRTEEMLFRSPSSSGTYIGETWCLCSSSQRDFSQIPIKLQTGYISILFLAGIDLIFFIVACTGLFFAFVTKTVLMIAQGYFSPWWAVLTRGKGLFSSSHHTTSDQVVVQKKLGGDTAGTADPSWPKGCPTSYGVLLNSRTWGMNEEEGTFGVMTSVFPSDRKVWWRPVFLEMAEHLSADGKQRINFLFSFACMVQLLLYLLNCIYLKPWVFPVLLLQFSSPSHCRGERNRQCWTELCTGVKPEQSATVTIHI